MTRRHLVFPSGWARLVGTIDEAPGATGLLMVSGGNEVRAGAWNGQSLFAAQVAAAGFPVFRFDRAGIGDSSGDNRGFRESGADIAAALARFRREAPQLEKIAMFGNCDAASALMLAGGAGADALLLANPWTIENDTAEAPPAVLRAHYLKRLTDLGALKRLLTGRIAVHGLVRSLHALVRPAPPPSTLAQEMAQGLAQYRWPVTFLLAGRDRTAQAFAAQWPRGDPRLRHCPEASHSFVEPAAKTWLLAQTLAVLRG